MRWGSIVRVNLDPAVGSEADKTRPALVVCNDRAVRAAQRNGRGVISVLPITSNTSRLYAFQVLIDGAAVDGAGLDQESKIQAEQIRSVDIRRIVEEVGELPERLHLAVREALALHLDLDIVE
nr:type II toxin-antitoxin system PemK/MazF family toxin [Actinoplanes solisilvae]